MDYVYLTTSRRKLLFWCRMSALAGLYYRIGIIII